MVDQSSRDMILKNPQASLAGFDPASHIDEFRKLSAVLDASSVDLDRLRARGAKLILIQGTSDTVVPPGNTIAYWERLRERYGRSLKQFARFYMVPGFAHASGSFVPVWDSLSALDRWVGAGVPPSGVIAADLAPGHENRSRPLCEYPAWPEYVSGDPNDGRNFKCAGM
jgi:feruloyl esterase